MRNSLHQIHQETTAFAVVRSKNPVSLLAVGDLTPEDTYNGRHRAILTQREKIKCLTLERREEENLSNAA
jgi:hypothetical protein